MAAQAHILWTPAKAPHSASARFGHRRPQMKLSAFLSHPDKPGMALPGIDAQPNPNIGNKMMNYIPNPRTLAVGTAV